jgi:RHS repeat-associated protein
MSFAYDANDMLISSKKGSSTLEQYWYDALGRRVKSITGSGGQAATEYTIYSGSAPIFLDDTKAKVRTLHVYANGMHIAKKTDQSQSPRFYYHCDALGSVLLVTDKNKAVQFDADYLPFGKAGRASGTESFTFLDSRTTGSSGLVHFGVRYYDPNSGRFTTPDPVLGALGKPVTLNRFAYCLNDPINRMDKDGQWSFFKKLTNLVSDVGALIGDTVEAVCDVVVAVVEATVEVVQKAIDTAQKFIEDVQQAVIDVVEAGISACQAVQRAWDNLDSGLKQWIINGVAMAVSFIPLVGPILSCVIDGTFVDMFNAIMKGDWAMVGMCALSFVPGVKSAAKGLKLAAHGDDIFKLGKKGPNPFGKLGKPAHQAKVNEIYDGIIKNGNRAKKEYHVTGKGVNRYADVAALDKNGKAVEIYQVGKQRLDEIPISRERNALSDIERAIGIAGIFIPYDD